MGEDSAESGELQRRLQRVLETWFLAEAEGRELDLAELCGGDAELLAAARTLIEGEPEGLFASDSGPPTGEAPPEGLEQIGEFALEGLLGRGGMGSVYLARQESLGRKVALKVLAQHALGDPNARLRFQREAQLAAALDHPGIVPVYSVGSEGAHTYIAMKLLSGPALHELPQPPAPRQVAAWGAAIARALDSAHLAGVIHRDIKPANVLLDEGQPVIVDFGLARSTVDRTLTRAGAVPGTLPYMAPEQLQQKRPLLDPRLDVYSLGASLYELLAGDPPFTHESTEQLLRRILLEDPLPLRPFGIDRDLQTIVLKALEKEPRRRYASALALAEDLERYLAGEPILARPSRVFSRYVKLARRHRRTSATVGVLGAVLLVVGGNLLASELRGRRLLGEGLARAEAQLEQGLPESALESLSAVQAVGEGDSEFDALRERAAELHAYDQLFEAVLHPSVLIETEALPELVARVRSGAQRPRWARLLLCFVHFHQGEDGAARDALRELEPGPGVRALRALLDASTDWPEARGEAPDGGDEWTLAAYASHLAGASLKTQEALLVRAMGLDPGHARALLLQGRCLAARGRYAEAEALLASLVQRPGLRRKAWRTIASCRLGRADQEGALEALSEIPRASWDAHELQIAASAYYELQQLDAYAELRDSLVQRPEDTAYNRTITAFEIGITSSWSRAARELDALLEPDASRRDRELALSTQLEFLSYWSEFAWGPLRSPGPHWVRVSDAAGAERWRRMPDVLGGLLRAPLEFARLQTRVVGARLLSELRLAGRRAKVHTCLARSAQLGWELEEMVAQYRQAIALDPGSADLRYELIYALYEHAMLEDTLWFKRSWPPAIAELAHTLFRSELERLWVGLDRGEFGLDAVYLQVLFDLGQEHALDQDDPWGEQRLLVRKLHAAADEVALYEGDDARERATADLLRVAELSRVRQPTQGRSALEPDLRALAAELASVQLFDRASARAWANEQPPQAQDPPALRAWLEQLRAPVAD